MASVFADQWLTVYGGDCRAVLRGMEPESVHCVVTSPPYWGLRDYGTPGQLGLEATPEEYVAAMVDVFREVRRVLRADGTVWLNLGDSYASGEVGRRDNGSPTKDGPKRSGPYMTGQQKPRAERRITQRTGLKPKDLVGIPWRVAFALQADGWYLRSDIIWSKPNPMPESVTDRPTKSHEYLFLLSKSARYFWDADAVRETAIHEGRVLKASGSDARNANAGDTINDRRTAAGFTVHDTVVAGRNIRSVWTIATAPYPGAHFATFPPKLVKPCVKAGTSERGVCPECGAPWERVLAASPLQRPEKVTTKFDAEPIRGRTKRLGGGDEWREYAAAKAAAATGWRPACAHDAEPVPATILDPFAGTGTVGLVAQSLSRRAVLIDLNPDYLRQCLARNAQTPLGI